MIDDFLDSTIDQLEKQLLPKKKTIINIIKKKNETVIKDISDKIDAVKNIDKDESESDQEIKQATKVVPWL